MTRLIRSRLRCVKIYYTCEYMKVLCEEEIDECRKNISTISIRKLIRREF